MKRLLLLFCFSSSAQAEPLEKWIGRTMNGPAVAAILADMDAHHAGLSRAVLAYRPSVYVGWETRVTADHKLPNPNGQKEKAWTANVEQLIWDFGATEQKREAEAFKGSAQEQFARRKIAEVVYEAGELYIRVWRAKQGVKAAAAALHEIADTMSFVQGRAKDNAASKAQVRDLEADRASIDLIRKQLQAEILIALAQMGKFGDAPKEFEAPKAVKINADAWRDAPEISEALLDAQAAESEALAALSARMPKISAYGTYDDIFDVGPDYRAGLRIRWDVFDSAGTDKDRAKAEAEASAARARAEAAQATSQARHATVMAQSKALRGMVETMARIEAMEVQRLDDTKAKHMEGKAGANEIVQAARRLFAVRKQSADTKAEIALASLRFRAMTGEFY